MTQNIYDDEAFFDAYAQLPRSRHGLDAAPEWPTLRAMLPPLAGRRVLDLGCGYGWFARFAQAEGAASVLGLDVSRRMLARAREASEGLDITYEQADLEHATLAPASFDLAYSSLAFHYLVHLGPLLARVHPALAAGGSLVFSVEHPMVTAPRTPGWIAHPGGHQTWPVDAYLDEGPRETSWLRDGVIKQHRTVATYLRLLTQAGFTLARLEEWAPSEAQLVVHPEWSPGERERPAFLLIACTRDRE